MRERSASLGEGMWGRAWAFDVASPLLQTPLPTKRLSPETSRVEDTCSVRPILASPIDSHGWAKREELLPFADANSRPTMPGSIWVWRAVRRLGANSAQTKPTANAFSTLVSI
jgi:hypothetical protein